MRIHITENFFERNGYSHMNIKGVKNDSTAKKSIGIGVLISILTGLVFIAVFAFIMTAGDLPKSAAAPLSSVAFGIGCFFSAVSILRQR